MVFVLDVYSWMIAVWQVANHMRTELPQDALVMPLRRRKIKKDSGLIHHSGREDLVPPATNRRLALLVGSHLCGDRPISRARISH